MKSSEPVISTADPGVRSNIRVVLKLLMAESDRRFEMAYLLRPSDLPKDMKAESLVLAAIDWCGKEGVPPMPTNVIAYLELDKRMENPRAFVEALLQENDQDTQGLKTLSSYVHQWLQERKLKAQGEAIAAIAANKELNYADKWEQAFQRISAVSPDSGFVYEAIDQEKFKMLAFKRNQEAIALRKSGMDVGITLPFEAAKAYFPYFHWNEVSLLVGREGTGKSSLASLLAESIADNVRLNCDVIYFALETPPDVLSMRAFARNRNIPLYALANLDIDLASDRWKPVWDEWMRQGKRKSESHSYLYHYYSPDISVTDLCMAMFRSSEASRVLGRKIVWIIDHLHSIDWEKTHRGTSEFDALRSIVRRLGATANKISTRVDNHLFIVAQEGEQRGQMFGGKFAAKRVQYAFTIQRERFGDADKSGNYPLADHDLPVTVPMASVMPSDRKSGYMPDPKDASKLIRLDALGKPRYWYRKGDEYSHKASLYISKANDNRLGVIRLNFEAAINKISQDPAQIEELRAANLLPPSNVRV